MGRRIAETERLIVRTHEATDVEPLARLWCDPKATAYMGGPRDFDRVCQSIRDDIALPEQPIFDLWTVIEKSTGEVIGHCGLLDKEIEGRPEIELVYLVAPRLWGRGYATEAGETIKSYAQRSLSRHRLVALVHPDNRASARVAEKLGFRFDHAVERAHGTMHLYVFATNMPSS
jgi:RimJ/RimL family protein N-acetyltransferase